MLVDDQSEASSSSKSINETINGSHHFTVTGYSLAKGMGPGNYITSDTFTVGGHEWEIYFYPDGKNSDDNSIFVSLFVALASHGSKVRALFELVLLDQSGNGEHRIESHFDQPLESGPYTLHCKGSMWGYKHYFERQTLESSGYIKDDSFDIRCTVGVVTSRVERHEHCRVPVPPSDIGRNFKSLLESEVGSDIVFQVGSETFKAHKLILAARSPVFRAQFYGLVGNTNAGMGIVVLEDIEPSIFKAMLSFIYSDEFPDVHEDVRAISMVTRTQYLLANADRFGLERLKKLCEAKLCEEVNNQQQQLKAICLKFASANLGGMGNNNLF